MHLQVAFMMAPKCFETANRLDALQSGGVILIKVVAGHKGQMLIRQAAGTAKNVSALLESVATVSLSRGTRGAKS